VGKRLLLLGVPERAVMGIMGRSSTAMAARYNTDPIRRDVARRVGGLPCPQSEPREEGNEEGNRDQI
jgi:integrase